MNHGKHFFVLALVLSGVLFFPRSLYAQETAFFREISGTVEVKAPGSAVWTNAAKGDRVEKNTLVSTGFRSTAVLVLGDSLITLRPVTRLSLEEIIRDQNTEQVNLYLHTGRVRAEVKPPAGGRTDFTVRSPNATASVRGTSFEFDTERLRVDEGRVQYFLTGGRNVSVAAGGMSYVDEASNTPVRSFDAAEELLVPADPLGNSSGGAAGDSAPAIILPGAGLELGYSWD
ncbi:MAG: FecR family protein [Treponema sp.]|jgi:ferric-dicitrate binding protein FerR (iron transport regulator)|nr:FecR family protein [Treponema sp.]